MVCRVSPATLLQAKPFRADFENQGVAYTVSNRTKSEIYDAFEPKLNAGEIELLDHPKLDRATLSLVIERRQDRPPAGRSRRFR